MLKPLRYKVGGPSEVYASSELRFFVRDEPQGYTIQDVCYLLDAEGMLARCMLLAGIADKMDGALRNLLILSSYSP